MHDSAKVRASDRAAVSGASLRTQRMADKVSRADPALNQRVAHGEVSLPKAVAQVEGRGRKPEKKPKAPDTDALAAEVSDLRDRIAEMSANAAELLADNESMAKVFEADDRLAAATAEVKRLNAEARVLRERINGLMNEKNQAIRQCKAAQRELAKLKGAA